MNDLELANGNAIAFWTLCTEARGEEIINRPGFVAFNGSERSGLRVITRTADLSTEDQTEIGKLVAERGDGPFTVEDAYHATDFSSLGLAMRELPVMIRRPGEPLPPPAREVIPVTTLEQFRFAEAMIVSGFPIERYQPYRPGELFPDSVFTRPEVEFSLVGAAGAGVAITDEHATGLYWVTTAPEHRSQGVGRAFMHHVLRRIDRPVTLSSSQAGKPLYDSLGFTVVTHSAWWSRPA